MLSHTPQDSPNKCRAKQEYADVSISAGNTRLAEQIFMFANKQHNVSSKKYKCDVYLYIN